MVLGVGWAAQRLIAFDMEALAREHGSVISAVLLGVLAASEVLPFPRDAYEAAIRASASMSKAISRWADLCAASSTASASLRPSPSATFSSMA